MIKRYAASQSIHIAGWECGTEVELKMVVWFAYHKGYPATHEDPPEPPSVDIDNVRFFEGVDEITMPEWLIEQMTGTDGCRDWLISEAQEAEIAAMEDAADAKREMMMDDRNV